MSATDIEARFLAEIAKHFSGLPKPVMEGWLGSPELLAERLEAVKLDGFSFQEPLTVECRERYTLERVIELLSKQTLRLDAGDWLSNVTERQWGAASNVRVRLVTPRQLGFADAAHLPTAWEQAKKFGLRRCPFRAIPTIKVPFDESGSDVVFMTQPVKNSGTPKLLQLDYGETDSGGGWGSAGWPYWSYDVIEATAEVPADTRLVFGA